LPLHAALPILPDHTALHLILDHRLSLARGLQANHGLDARRRLGGVAVAPAPVIELRAPLGARLLAHLIELLLARVAAIGAPSREQLLGYLAVPDSAGKLEDDVAVPIDAEPGKAVNDGVDRGLGRALAVGILDPQQHLAAAPARVEPVEQRSARSPDMEKASGRGGKASDDGLRHPGGRRAFS